MEKIVIIGGGIAGLTAGIYARLAGFEAEIYEKNSLPGGECMGWNRNGYHIDNCIHWLTGTRKGTDLYNAWKTVGALTDDMEYAKVDSFFTSVLDGERVTLWADLDKTKEELIALSPDDKDEIEKFIQTVEFSRQCQLPLKKPMEMFGIKDYIALGKEMADFPKVIKEFGSISLYDYSRRFKHPLIQRVLVDYLPKDYCAYSFFVSYATIADGNGNIPMGASLNMSLRMEKHFKDLGGKIYYEKPVSSISLGNKKATGVVLEDGTEVKADYIIPAVDTSFLFNKLLPSNYMPKMLKTAYTQQNHYPINSGFQMAFSAPLSFNPGETVFNSIEPTIVGKNIYDRLCLKVYNYDPIFIKGERCVIQTNIGQNADDFAYWKALSKEEYKQKKDELVSKITKQLTLVYPELEGNIEFLDCWTPLTYERYCNAYCGSYMSFTTIPGGKQVNIDGRIKGINNVFIAGQWTYSPGGLPVAVASGKFAVQRICRKLKKEINIGQ